HGDGTERVLALHGLVGEAVARTAAPAAFRTSTLDHEVGHDAVEREAVVVALMGQCDEVVDRVRRERGIEVHDDRTAVGRDGHPVRLGPVDLEIGGLGHARSSLRSHFFLVVVVVGGTVVEGLASAVVTWLSRSRAIDAHVPVGALARYRWTSSCASTSSFKLA